MANIVSEDWWDIYFRIGEQEASGTSISEVLPAHDAYTASSSNTQYIPANLSGAVIDAAHFGQNGPDWRGSTTEELPNIVGISFAICLQ